MSESLHEKIDRLARVAKVQNYSLHKVLSDGMDGTFIGIVRLLDDQTLGLTIQDGALSIGRDVTVEIPSLDMLKSQTAIFDHLCENTSLRIKALEGYRG